MFSPPPPEDTYISRRSPLVGRRGMVASSQPLASEAGLKILREGGNAADAAVAMAAALNVCEPCSTGIGGDAFVLWYDAKSKRVESIQGNGRSPQALTLDLATRERGYTAMLPKFHALTVTVPGAAACWVDTVEKYGSMSMERVLAPAVELADGGWPVAPFTAAAWCKGEGQLLGGGPHGIDLLKDGKRGPVAGEVMYNPHLANTFKTLAALGKPGFYSGRIAASICDALQRAEGVMAPSDLSAHTSAFEAPISVVYRGQLRVWEVPPPTHGMAALAALNTLEAYYDLQAQAQGQGKRGGEGGLGGASGDQASAAPTREGECSGGDAGVGAGGNGAAGSSAGGAGGGLAKGSVDGREEEWGSVEHQHVLIECMRLAFADSLSLVCDPFHTPVPLDAILSKKRAIAQAHKILANKGRAGVVLPVGGGDLLRIGSDTVYFCAVDKWGNGCSMINSNFMGFGTGIVPEGCGFTLQNRGHGFSLDPAHPNCLAPLKRPYHTIIPGLATFPTVSDTGTLDNSNTLNSTDMEGAGGPGAPGVPAGHHGELHSVFGVMGGFMQPQGHMQLVSNIVDYKWDPQHALDKPRFCLTGLPCQERGHGAYPLRSSQVVLEAGPGREAVARGLRERGHSVEIASGEGRETFGKGQMIARDPTSGVLWAGSEGRADGCAIGF